MASATRALNEMGVYVEQLEAERDQLHKDMDRLLAAAFEVCSYPDDWLRVEDLRELAGELEAGRGEKTDG